MAKISNKNLNWAKAVKNDEFYTMYYTISEEVYFYKEQLKNKIIYCNCDDIFKSNFPLHFIINFKKYQLKKLITVGFTGDSKSFKYEITPEIAADFIYKDGVKGLLEKHPECKIALKGNGDFRSEESIEILKTADIVITNPPFSLFREFFKQLIDYNKKFLIIGNPTNYYVELNDFFKKNLFTCSKKGNGFFYVPDSYVNDSIKKINGKRAASIVYTWFTNLTVFRKRKWLKLTKKYYGNEFYYPFYENNVNYKGEKIINVDYIKDIPKDYFGVFGAPVHFMQLYNDKQFEFIDGGFGAENKIFTNVIQKKYKRYVDNKNTGTTVMSGRQLFIKYNKKRDGKKETLYVDEKGDVFFKVYKRVLFRLLDKSGIQQKGDYMSKLKGDCGFTRILKRNVNLRKNNILLKVLGTIDELVASLNLVKFHAPDKLKLIIEQIQKDLFKINNNVSFCIFPGIDKEFESDKKLFLSRIKWLEDKIDVKHKFGNDWLNFIDNMPLVAIYLNISRTITRRCERNYWALSFALNKNNTDDDLMGIYINRLSDLLFILIGRNN